MTWYWFALALALGAVAVVLQLLRSQRIREKYAATWIVLAIGVVLLGLFPGLATVTARAVGVQTPINLVFALATLVLFAVLVQLSAEVSHAEETTRTLAERIALLQLELHELRQTTEPAGTTAQRPQPRPAASDPARPADDAGEPDEERSEGSGS